MGNSVIYRPAYDAEVEYLESTGTQWIDTGFIPDDTCGLYVRAYPLNTSSQKKVAGCGSSVQSSPSRWWINFSSYVYIEISWNDFNKTIPYNKNQWYEATNNFLNSRTATIDGVNQNVPYPTLRDNNYTAYIFNVNSNVPDAFVGKISSVKFSRGSEIVMDFIPVRIGSVGYMYDKVSKQLFANKGTGQFILGNDVSNAVIPQQRCVLYFGNQRSVGFERIYEEYEWLIKELTNTQDEATYGNKAVIDTLVDFTDDLIIEATLDNTERVDNRGFGIVTSTGNAYVPFLSHSEEYFAAVVLNKVTNIQAPVINVSYSLSDITINGVTTSYAQETLTEHPSVAIGAAKSYSGAFYYRVSSIQINTSGTAKYGNFIFKKGNLVIMHLVPCRLLQSIPAILDGNGIARQAGECGMWDKVSNKFYGNVANSGTFTVKGPKCYEEYRWLKNIVVGHVRDMMKLPILSYSFSFSRKILSGVNVPYFFTMNDRDAYLNTSNAHTIQIWNSTQGLYYSSGQSFDRNDAISIVSSTEGLVVNSQTIPQNTFPVWYIYFGANDANGTENYTSSITVDGSVRYVPCKLTHGIPASMDANGIARPAGTCGMWDKVNDKFYGNVASSGTFTVSND